MAEKLKQDNTKQEQEKIKQEEEVEGDDDDDEEEEDEEDLCPGKPDPGLPGGEAAHGEEAVLHPPLLQHLVHTSISQEKCM